MAENSLVTDYHDMIYLKYAIAIGGLIIANGLVCLGIINYILAVIKSRKIRREVALLDAKDRREQIARHIKRYHVAPD